MRALRWFTFVLTCLLVSAVPLLGQDSAVVGDPGIDAGALAFGWSELVKWLIAAGGTYGIYYANVVKGWISTLGNELKFILNLAFTTALMLLGEFFHAVISSNPADWTAATFEGLAAGILTSIAVKLGINTAQSGPEGAATRPEF